MNITVVDNDTHKPIPYASIMWSLPGTSTKSGKSTDRNGYAEIPNGENVYDVTVSSVGYIDKVVKKLTHDNWVVYLDKYVGELNEVIVTSGKKENNYIWLVVLAVIGYYTFK